eukprot:gene2486-2861_t
MEITKEATIGPNSWKQSSIRNIRLSQTVAQRSDKFNDLGRQLDPLPSLRDSCIQQSNAQIHGYVRETRVTVISLKDSLLETEEEIKSLLRGKENLEKALEHIRKDILLNQQSAMRRNARPIREREADGADDLLAAEKEHFLKLKRILEAQLRSVQKQLQVLDNARKRLKAVISERSRVLDLICHAVPSVRSSSSTRMRDAQASGIGLSLENPLGFGTDPLGPNTPEVSEAIALASDARQRSVVLRKEVIEAINQTTKLLKAAHRSVNDGLTKKISETVTIKQHLQMAQGDIRVARHRGERWHYATDVARGYTLGPVSSKDLTTREKLDRPTVAIYQRHPGTQLLRHNRLSLLTQKRLQRDVSDKTRGTDVDSSAVRLRRRRSDHRWVIGGVGC